MLFVGEYDYLSNFFPSPVTLDFEGVVYVYPTVENAFQAAKIWASPLTSQASHTYLHKLTTLTPSKAKYEGRKIRLDAARWDELSEDVMLYCLKQKFAPGTLLAAKLVATKDEFIAEDNNHGDRLWGRVNGVGENKLGVLLMGLRQELLNEAA